MAHTRSEEDRLLLDSMVMSFCETFSFAGLWKPMARSGSLRHGPGREDFETLGARLLAQLLVSVGMLAAVTLAAGLSLLVLLAVEAGATTAAMAGTIAGAMILLRCIAHQQAQAVEDDSLS
ncbi:hypothetical protein [Oleisolibacter albus]|uniref:hypothetical protein n=1 Tax=Oleisolibacter albus TaxID=2171757 RepID=UPI000DF499D3|nr:hypothetical protein [Oleisolibacter albus]